MTHLNFDPPDTLGPDSPISLNLPTAQINIEGAVLWQNSAFRQLVAGPSPRNGLPHRLGTLVTRRTLEAGELVPYQCSNGKGKYWINFVRYKNDTYIMIMYPATIVKNGDGEKEEMRERILQLETFLDTSFDGFWICDHEGKVVQINKAAVRLNGLEGQSIIGRYVGDLVAEGYYDRSVTLEVLGSKKPVTAIVNSSNGKTLLATGKPMFDLNGKIKNVIVNVRDVTVLNELRQRLKKTEAIKERYRSEAMRIRASCQIQEKIVYCSRKMDELMASAHRVAETEATILIQGESGVGKSLLAEYLHSLSSRGDGPFFTINCSIIPPSLIESELFGYKGGAFTGASSKGKPGLVEMSDGGTLFLDEIAELPSALQAKLLDFMENTSFTRVGGVTRRKIDTRIICATNRDLDEMVRDKLFRDDLYFRLSTVPIHIPPLRSRPEDISLLLKAFLNQFNERHQKAVSLSPNALTLFLSLRLPGNVRELKHLVERIVVMADSEELGAAQVEELLFSGQGDPQSFLKIPVNLTMAEAREILEKKMIQQTLAKGHNQESAAILLGLNQSTISRKIRKHKIVPPSFKSR